ncbi:MAG: hypothetical protein KF862_16825 [Chitinophagaceae bacterium]|nr:hypothetical protein [Chitinophagaceae bacterium]
MERIGVLINKLQELYQQRAAPDQVIHVVQMLQTELFLLKQQQQNVPERKKISVLMPAGITIAGNEPGTILDSAVSSLPQKEVAEALEEKPAEPLAEALEEKPAEPLAEEVKSQEPVVERKRFNVLEEVPTLAHQPQVKELNEVIGFREPSLNERLHQPKVELAEKLKDEPLKDIKKAIGLNDRYIFITELFRGDEAMYERSLKTINHFTIYPEAEFWIQRELKLKLGWKEDHPSVKQFDQLVKRRFL